MKRGYNYLLNSDSAINSILEEVIPCDCQQPRHRDNFVADFTTIDKNGVENSYSYEYLNNIPTCFDGIVTINVLREFKIQTDTFFGHLINTINGPGKIILSGDMKGKFANCKHFEGGSTISRWDVSQVTNMEKMFVHAEKFNANLTEWDVGQVTNMNHMFYWARNFNGDISKWKPGKVTMQGMFSGARSFNGDIAEWDVSKVTTMEAMFSGAISFNRDISKWKVGKVEDMEDMFSYAYDFNCDISGWDVRKVDYFNNMFCQADSFNYNLKKWKLNSDQQVQINCYCFEYLPNTERDEELR